MFLKQLMDHKIDIVGGHLWLEKYKKKVKKEKLRDDEGKFKRKTKKANFRRLNFWAKRCVKRV